MKSQTHKAGSVRHAEKRRTSTCAFADRVAQVSIQEFHRRVPQKWRQENKQVCLATIVAHFKPNIGTNGDVNHRKRDCEGSLVTKDENDDDEDNCSESSSQRQILGKMKVVALGVGTKFLSESKIKDEEGIESSAICSKSDGLLSSYGMRLRDSHAEVLARRAFRRALSIEMMALAAMDYHRDDDSSLEQEVSILRRIDVSETVDGISKGAKYHFSLVEGVTLHFYTSSTPCGNSSLKKFSKMTKEKFDASIHPDQWTDKPHGPFNAHSLHLGRCSLLVKKKYPTKDCGEHDKVDVGNGNEDVAESKKEVGNTSHIRPKERKWPSNLSDDWCPPGTTLPHFGRGSLHSCSDKICRWNCIGLQGSLLSSLLDKPLYIDTLTVGRKFTRCICERAICCRANGYGDHHDGSKKNASSKGGVTLHGGRQRECGGNGNLTRFKLNHPAVMGTGVYLDATGTIDMSGSKTVGQDVRFLSNLCWVWWSDPNIDNKGGERIRLAECIDGDEGLQHCYSDSDAGSDIGNDTTRKCCSQEQNIFSAVSTYALYKIFLKVRSKTSRDTDETGDTNTNGIRLNGDKDEPLTLSDLRALKRYVSPKYETAKDNLLHRHGIFYQWNRRCSRMTKSDN